MEEESVIALSKQRTLFHCSWAAHYVSVCMCSNEDWKEPLAQGAGGGGWRGQVGLVNFKCFNKQAEIVLECDCSTGLVRLCSPQRRVMFYMLLAYIETGSPGLVSVEMRRD